MESKEQQNQSTNNDQKPPANWRDSLPDDLKNEPSLAAIGDVNILAKSYVHAQKAIGADKVVKPSKHATPEDWQKFYKEIGVPDEKDYKLEFSEEEKKSIAIDEKFGEFFTKAAAKAQLMPNQAKNILAESVKFIKQAETEQAQAKKLEMQKQLDGLKTEWGAAFDIKANQAHQAFLHFGKDIPGFKEWFDSSGVGNNPQMIKMFAAVAETLKEGQIKNAAPAGGGVMTPKEAMQKANEILGSSSTHPYWDAAHPNHANAVAELKSLYQMAYPTEGAQQ